jgi:release factor glutamine methyltransferase
VDLLVCNPPYVPDATPVPPEVAAHDPSDAVFGGADGLDVIRAVVALGPGLLRPGGWIGIEHDETHVDAVVGLLDRAGYGDAAMHRDLAGRPRFTAARHAGK